VELLASPGLLKTAFVLADAVYGALTINRYGEGVDQFDLSSFTAANAGAAVAIIDFTKGETIKFASSGEANFASSKVVPIAEATFDNYVAEAATAAEAAAQDGADDGAVDQFGIAWFQFGGNTFVVRDVKGDAAFSNNIDMIVNLPGLVDLFASFFNEADQGARCTSNLARDKP